MFRVRAVLAALVAGCLLVACSNDDPEPKVADPTPSAGDLPSAATTSPTGSPTTGQRPESTVQAWVDAQNLALATGKTQPLRVLAEDGCEGCDDFPDGIDKIIEAGGHFEGGQWTLVRAEVEDPSARPLRVDAAVEIAAGTTVTEAGAPPTAYAASKRLFVFELVNRSGKWLIALIGSLS
jgi:hypothetical protein